jgi:RND family efflux transporter MFP subunit
MQKTLFQLLALSGLMILTSCEGKKQEVAEDTTAKVKTITAGRQSVDETATYTANVQADVINQITPAMPGRIEKIYVEIGNRVGKGQLLVQMESSSLQQQTAQLMNLERDYERYSELLKVGGVAQQAVDQLKMQIDVLKASMKNVEDNTQLRSPINGVVTARNYDDGNVFGQLPILTVQQMNPLKAIINVSEANFSRVKVGMPVDLRLDVYRDEAFSGKVDLIYPTIDASSHTFGVEVSIDNREMKIRPGMFARVTLKLGTQDHIVIPDAAVQKQTGSNDKYVYVVENGIARYYKVTLGQRQGDRYEILSGLNDGQEVITAGHARLIDGTKVEVITN